MLAALPFGKHTMPTQSPAADLHRLSLPPQHRAGSARWRGGKENLRGRAFHGLEHEVMVPPIWKPRTHARYPGIQYGRASIFLKTIYKK